MSKVLKLICRSFKRNVLSSNFRNVLVPSEFVRRKSSKSKPPELISPIPKSPTSESPGSIYPTLLEKIGSSN